MSVPVFDSKHLAEALAYLTEQFRDATTLKGFITALMGPIQELEGVFWDIINKRLLNPSIAGDQLDQIGAIVGEARQGRTDADYYQAVILRIRVNRSQGGAFDIIDVAYLALRKASKPNYVENTYPSGLSNAACFLVECFNLLSPNVAAEFLSRTRSAGVYGVLHYTTWAPGSDFIFTSRAGGVTAQGTWGSRYGGVSNPGLLCASAPLTVRT